MPFERETSLAPLGLAICEKKLIKFVGRKSQFKRKIIRKRLGKLVGKQFGENYH